MATRRYSRRTRLSQSVERPTVADSQSDSDEQNGDIPVLAPFVAATGPSAPGTPANASNMGTPQGCNDTQSVDRAAAAPVTSPVRKQRRVTRSNAPADRHQQDVDASSAAAVRPATPRPPVNTGAGDDVEAQPC